MSDFKERIKQLEQELSEARKYKDELDFPMEELCSVLPPKEGSYSDKEIILESKEQLSTQKAMLEKMARAIQAVKAGGFYGTPLSAVNKCEEVLEEFQTMKKGSGK